MIKKILKHTFKFVLNILNTALSALLILYLSRPLRRLAEQVAVTTPIQNKKSCLVLGNGPSADLVGSKISDVKARYDVLAMNFFALSPLFDVIRPRYYILQDSNIFNGNKIKFFQDKNDALLNKLEAIEYELTLFVPVLNKHSKFVKKLRSSSIRVCFYNPTPVDGFSWFRSMCFKLQLGMPRPETVANAAIFIAISLGYKSVHLLGCEQSWLKNLFVDEDNMVHVSLQHFYGGNSSLGRHSSLTTLATFLESQAKCFRSHEKLADYAVQQNCDILNCTPGSYIDAYSKSSFLDFDN